MELADSYRPADIWGASRFEPNLSKSPRSSAVEWISQLAAELDVDPADIAPTRIASTHTDQSSTIRELRRLAETGAVSAHELRRQAREAGIPIGNERADAEDFENTCRHESGHAIAAHGLGWHVVYVDARAGETKIEPPEYWEQSLTDRFLQHATIAAAGSVAAGTSSKREENMNDRVSVRLKGHVDFEEGRKRAELVLADRWAKPALERLTAALLEHGRLEGDELLRVLEGD